MLSTRTAFRSTSAITTRIRLSTRTLARLAPKRGTRRRRIQEPLPPAVRWLEAGRVVRTASNPAPERRRHHGVEGPPVLRGVSERPRLHDSGGRLLSHGELQHQSAAPELRHRSHQPANGHRHRWEREYELQLLLVGVSLYHQRYGHRADHGEPDLQA